jgi:hypothetical protein
MLSLADRMDPRFTLEQIEQAILQIPDIHITAAARYGISAEEGCRMARAQMADDVRRHLHKLIATPVEDTPRDRG